MKSILFFLFAAFAFSSCLTANLLGPMEDRTFADPERWIPEDFNANATVLLIENYPNKKSDEAMKEFLVKNYKGKYEIVDRNTITSRSGKYTDTKMYPYGFIWNRRISQPVGTNVSSRSVLEYDGHFYDRIAAKQLLTTRKFNNYRAYSYVPFINTIIKHGSK